MRIAVTEANLHEGVFIDSTNLGKKLGGPQTKPVVLFFDTLTQCLAVQFKEGVTLVPHGTVANMKLTSPKEFLQLAPEPDQIKGPQAIFGGVTNPQLGENVFAAKNAQLEDPTKPKVGRK